MDRAHRHLGFGAIGWVDDWRKVVNKDPEGMRSREKYFWQSVIGLVAALYLVFSISGKLQRQVWGAVCELGAVGLSLDLPPKAGLQLPFFKEVSYPLGVLGFVILTYLVIVGSSNAVNLTDGSGRPGHHAGGDGGLGPGRVCLRHRQLRCTPVPVLPAHPGLGRTADLLRRHGGRGLAFLWFNAHPAQVFMGDVGALALGGALGTIAVIVRQEIVLAIGRHLCGRGPVGDAAGDLVQVHQKRMATAKAAACSRWRRCTTTLKRAAGKKRRWSCASGSSPCCCASSACPR